LQLLEAIVLRGLCVRRLPVNPPGILPLNALQ
jgi:hypothetical protein